MSLSSLSLAFSSTSISGTGGTTSSSSSSSSSSSVASSGKVVMYGREFTRAAISAFQSVPGLQEVSKSHALILSYLALADVGEADLQRELQRHRFDVTSMSEPMRVTMEQAGPYVTAITIQLPKTAPTPVSDKALATLARICPNLEVFNIEQRAATGNHVIQAIARLQCLQETTISPAPSAPPAFDKGKFSSFCGHKSLRAVHLWCPLPLTDDRLNTLATIPNLEEITVPNIFFNNDGPGTTGCYRWSDRQGNIGETFAGLTKVRKITVQATDSNFLSFSSIVLKKLPSLRALREFHLVRESALMESPKANEIVLFKVLNLFVSLPLDRGGMKLRTFSIHSDTFSSETIGQIIKCLPNIPELNLFYSTTAPTLSSEQHIALKDKRQSFRLEQE